MATPLLIAIDGTDSAKWRSKKIGHNSHVHRFFLDFAGVENTTKYYDDGPGISGIEMNAIIQKGMTWLLGVIRKEIAKPTLDAFTINLVGHSRGGLAVIAIANGLNNLMLFEARNGYQNLHKGLPNSLPVHFMGLYDAVKRAPQIGAETELPNVRHIAHARRLNPPIFRTSRPSFSGMDTRGSLWFDTSHGGVGGDPGLFQSLDSITNLWKDIYCNALQLVLSDQEWKAIQPSIWHPFSLAWIGNEDKAIRANKIRQYINASRMADKYVRSEAKMAGVPFQSTTPHIP